MSNTLIQFRCPPDLEGELKTRTRAGGSTATAARRDLQRYYGALQYELADVELTEAEAKLLCDALNGCWLLDVTTPSSARMHLLAESEDHVRLNGAAKKWGVDWDHLRATLADLTPVQCLAVMDAVERFWTDDAATVESVGLIPGSSV